MEMTIQGDSSKGEENIPRTSPSVKLKEASSLEMASVKVVGNPLYLTQNEDGGGMDTIHRPFYWEQKVFLPTKRNIMVLNSVTGALEYTLEVQLDTCSSSSSNTFVECACLVEDEHVVMASLSNSTIVEWSINPEDLDSIENLSVVPRRKFQLGVNKKIMEDHQNTTAISSHEQYQIDQRSRLIHVVSYPSHKRSAGGNKTYHYSNNFCLCAVIQPPLSSSTYHGDSSKNKVKCCKLVEIAIPRFEKIHNKNKNFTTIITTYRTIVDTIPYCSAEKSGHWNFPLSLHSFTCGTRTKSSQLHDEDSDTHISMIAIVMKESILFYYDSKLKHDIYDDKKSVTERDQQHMKRDCRSISYTPVSGKFNVVKKGKKKKTEEEIVDTTKGNKHGSHISCVAFNTLHDGNDASVADMAIGYSNGHINIFYNFFATITHLFDTYMSSSFSDDHETRKEHKREKYRKLKHFNKGTALKLSTKDLLASSTVIIKTLHWHVHPVLTMIFYSPTILMSAGEEAVVATWSLFAQQSDATMNKPTHTLPRVTKGDIILLLAATSASSYDTSGIVILGRENSVQFVSIPEYSSKWHLQGIACVSGEHRSNTCTVKASGSGYASACYSYDVVMKIDPRYGIPVCANLPGSPGFLQWYNLPNKSGSSHNVSLFATVQMKLQVAAYNRVSRTDRSGPANLAANQVTHFAMSEDGTTLLTVDITLLQLTTLGRNVLLVDQNGKETAVSQVFTLKFWYRFTTTHDSTASATVGNETPPYELNALIMHPHGRCAAVTGLILSHNGNIGVTTSMEENCFRVWKRQASAIPNGTTADSSLSSAWKCVFHLQTPAGFQPPSGPMAFSPDDSLLAVANGNVVTLWDYEQSAFLRSIGCGHPESFTVKELYLDETARIIVTNTDSAKIECHSIFPQKEQSLSSSKIWEWSFNDSSCKEYDGVSRASVTCYLSSLKKFAVAVATSYKIIGKPSEPCSITKLFFVDALTGMQSDSNAVCTIDGKVLSMCSYGDRILLWMDTNELMMVRYSHDLSWLPSSGKAGVHHIQQSARQTSGKSAALSLLFVDDPKKEMNKKKMKRTIISITSDDAMLNKRQMIVEGFGIGQIQNSELPSLSSTFIRDFIGQRLPKFDRE